MVSSFFPSKFQPIKKDSGLLVHGFNPMEAREKSCTAFPLRKVMIKGIGRIFFALLGRYNQMLFEYPDFGHGDPLPDASSIGKEKQDFNLPIIPGVCRYYFMRTIGRI